MSLSSPTPPPLPIDPVVVVLYDLDLDEQQVHIRQNERLRLHSKESKDWWLVSRIPNEDITKSVKMDSSTDNDDLGSSSSESRSMSVSPTPATFFVPSSYLRLLKTTDADQKEDPYEKTSDEALGSSQDSLNVVPLEQDEIDHQGDDESSDPGSDFANLPSQVTLSTSHYHIPHRMAPLRPTPEERYLETTSLKEIEDANDNKIEGIYAEPLPVRVAPRTPRTRLPPLYANIDLLGPTSSSKTTIPVEDAQQQAQSLLGSYKLRRTLWDDWVEYEDREGQRPPLFYNRRTQQLKMKPPRRLTIGSTIDEIDETSASSNQPRVTSTSTQTVTPYTAPLERRRQVKENEILLSEDSGDELAVDTERVQRNVKDIVKKWNESSMRTRRLPSLTNRKRGSVPIGSRPSLPLNKGLRGVSRSSEDLLESSTSSPTQTDFIQRQQQPPNSPLTSISELLVNCPPESWLKRHDPVTKQIYFVNANDRQWFCKQDENGKIYFYNGTTEAMVDENRNDGSSSTNPIDQMRPTLSTFNRSLKANSVAALSSPPPPPTSMPPRILRADNHEVIFSEQFKHSSPFQNLDTVFPLPPTKLEPNDMIFDGYLNRTLTVVKGVRQKRKNWTSSYVVLTQYYLLFFKDRKQAAKESPKTEFVLGLWNGKVEWCHASKSSRKNCFQVSTFCDQVLLQDDQADQCKKWYDTIGNCIAKLPSLAMNIQSSDAIFGAPSSGGSMKLKRSRSTKQYRPVYEEYRHASGCSTLAGYGTYGVSSVSLGPPSDKKVKISERLINFFKKRPSIESLREKGIIRDEAVFGSTLERLSQRDRAPIPKFVTTCIQAIEAKDLRADGIYRACGNLSTVQRLRFEANQEKYAGLWKEEDVHVLTGLLKMFFRDMKEPLFPCDCMPHLMEVIAMKSAKDKLKEMKKLILELPEINYQTLKLLLQHLLRVISYSAENRMHIQNLAIVFGPTLMRSASDLNNLTLEMMMQMQQSQVVDLLLQEYDKIFDK